MAERPASPAVQAKYSPRATAAPRRTAEEIHDQAMRRPAEGLHLASHGLKPAPAAPQDTPENG